MGSGSSFGRCQAVSKPVSTVKDGVRSVSFNPSTPISVILQLLRTNKIGVVNLLAIEPGSGGQAYQYRLASERFKIMVDGGINGETARVAANDGTDILVSASFLFLSKDIASSSAGLMCQ